MLKEVACIYNVLSGRAYLDSGIYLCLRYIRFNVFLDDASGFHFNELSSYLSPKRILSAHILFSSSFFLVAYEVARKMDAPPNQNQAQPIQGTSSLNGSLQIESPILPQMMNMVGDPTLAAATAASSFYPMQAMFNNSGSFFPMPQMFTATGMQAAAAPTATAEAASSEVATTPMVPGHHTMPTGFNPNSFQINGSSNAWPQPMIGTTSGFQGAMDCSLQNLNASTAMQVQMAAAAAAAAAVPNATTSDGSGTSKHKMTNHLTADEKLKLNRDRNREHARTTRLRKKAYVQKLKEMVDGLHAERTEEAHKRRVAMQHLAEKQTVRRSVVQSFLRFHATYESDPRKWITILEEDNFWLKQPVTPYRAFPREEIEQVRPFNDSANGSMHHCERGLYGLTFILPFSLLQ